MSGRIQPKYEFDILGMDLLKLGKSHDNKEHVLVVIDHFTRFAWVAALKTKKMEEVFAAFSQVVLPLNRPTILLSDNGLEFKNEKFEKYCKTFGVQQVFVTPYHPQSDGVVERFNRTLIAMLRAYADESCANWTDHLQKVCAAYNSMPHATNGLSPFHSLFKIPKQQDLLSVPSLTISSDPSEFEQLREWITQYRTVVQERTDESNNKGRKQRQGFSVGDLVWWLDYQVAKKVRKGARKLTRRWCGPWTVTSTWGNVIVTIKRVGGGAETRRAHVDQLKSFAVSTSTPRELRHTEPERPSTAEQRQVTVPKADASEAVSDDEDQVEYEVEKVVGHFINETGIWFLVQWKGYDDPTWEHEDNLCCGEMVTRYFRNVCREP